MDCEAKLNHLGHQGWDQTQPYGMLGPNLIIWDIKIEISSDTIYNNLYLIMWLLSTLYLNGPLWF